MSGLTVPAKSARSAATTLCPQLTVHALLESVTVYGASTRMRLDGASWFPTVQ